MSTNALQPKRSAATTHTRSHQAEARRTCASRTARSPNSFWPIEARHQCDHRRGGGMGGGEPADGDPFCTSIGCTGYQDFKLRLAQSLALGMSATHSVIDAGDNPAKVSEKIFDYTITSLDWVAIISTRSRSTERRRALPRPTASSSSASAHRHRRTRRPAEVSPLRSPLAARKQTPTSRSWSFPMRSPATSRSSSHTGATLAIIETARRRARAAVWSSASSGRTARLSNSAISC